ncbi:hypothetical protein RISK_002520 [Rhodopirellula islandica]|uniref:Uncharacterized protein n=1 Tax=Rhodopirellula islandica TaxID=595434 RepID=A0A0J1BH87_RHOIS|nr:hypothetical protein RISK_002520 [Rhodopirellula islandica]
MVLAQSRETRLDLPKALATSATAWRLPFRMERESETGSG